MERTNFMRKAIISYIIVVVIFISGISYLVHKGFDSYEGAKDDMGSHIGDTVVIGIDTSIVVDYNTFNNTYTLSNGVEVAKEIVE